MLNAVSQMAGAVVTFSPGWYTEVEIRRSREACRVCDHCDCDMIQRLNTGPFIWPTRLRLYLPKFRWQWILPILLWVSCHVHLYLREACLVRLNAGHLPPPTNPLRRQPRHRSGGTHQAPSADNDQSPLFLRVVERLGAPLSHRRTSPSRTAEWEHDTRLIA